MKKSKNKGWIAAAVVGALAFVGFRAAAKAETGGGGNGGGDLPDPWTPGPGGKGKVYGGGGGGGGGGSGVVKGLPADFDFSGNGLWISPNCDGVVEGGQFRPDPGGDTVNAIEPTESSSYVNGNEVEATLGVDSSNSIAGFIDWWMARRDDLTDRRSQFSNIIFPQWAGKQPPKPLQATLEFTAELLKQVSPGCLEVDPKDWGEPLQAWLRDFMLWADLYLHEWWSDEIAFDIDV